MKNIANFSLLAASIALAASQASASTALDTRSMSMGGTGVASASYLTAPFHNPALAAHAGEYDFVGLLAPYASVVINDKDEVVVDAVDLAKILVDVDEDDSIDVGDVIVDVADYIVKLQGSQFYTEAGAGISFQIPNNYLSLGVFAQARSSITGILDITEEDVGLAEDCLAAELDPVDDCTLDIEDLTSQAITVGAAIMDVGATLAIPFNINTRRKHGREAKDLSYDELFTSDKLYIGITPKYQHIATVNYGKAINQFDCYDDSPWEFDCERLDKTYENFTNGEGNANVDVGIAYHNTAYNLMLGLTAKNLITNEVNLETLRIIQPGDTERAIRGKYEVNPVVTIGTSWSNGFATVTGDVDLNAAKNITELRGVQNFSTESDDVQMLKLGTELNFYWAQLRAGYNTDLKGNLNGLASLGLGLAPFNLFHVDLGVNSDLKSSLGVSVQTMFTF